MMDLKNIGEIVATRNLYLIDDEKKKVSALIGEPNRFPDSSDYYCPYQILGIGDEKIRYAAGIDAVQAIQLAMVMIGEDLNMSNETKANRLRWEGDEKGYLGFPAS